MSFAINAWQRPINKNRQWYRVSRSPALQHRSPPPPPPTAMTQSAYAGTSPTEEVPEALEELCSLAAQKASSLGELPTQQVSRPSKPPPPLVSRVTFFFQNYFSDGHGMLLSSVFNRFMLRYITS